MYSFVKRVAVSALIVLIAVAIGSMVIRAEDTNSQKRETARKAFQNGNFKDAYNLYSALSLDAANDPLKVGDDLNNSIICLLNLNRLEEVDDLREKVIDIHKTNWHLLARAAQTLTEGQHFGFVIAGKFERGNHRGGNGRYVTSQARDRGRALQLLKQALAASKDDTDKVAVAEFYVQFSNTLMLGGFYEAWKLQDLTEIEKLPDVEDGYGGRRGYRGFGFDSGVHPAPTDADGNPIYYKVPKSFADAANDGERWRFCLMQAEELNPARAAEMRYTFAQFLQNQFDVQTMSGFSGRDEGDEKDQGGPFAVKTLGEDETLARLASGIKRFKLPDEFNFIKIFQNVADQFKGNVIANQAIQALAGVFENRQQYDRAADYWKRSIAEYGPQSNLQQRVDQILGNWGTFESVGTQAATENTSVEYRYRNGSKVSFEATEINVKKLLDDVKAHIKSKPNQLDWQTMNIDNIGYRLVEQNQTQYLGAKAASWEMELKPREKHFDRRVTVTTPLKKAGAYLVTAKMANGNITRIVMWLADTAIVKKQLDKQAFYYIADAETGKPVPGAKLDFFGYRQQWNNNTFSIDTAEHSATADGEGQVFLNNADLSNNHSWLITASTADGRLAHLGFTGIWFGQMYDAQYNQIKSFGMTDRPVYRPDQLIKFKFWTGNAKYDQAGPSQYAGKDMALVIFNPKGEKIFEKTYKADEFGGIDGEFKLDKEATLGQYRITLPHMNGNLGFRLEEYKKPEFEVKVDAPSDPVMLGEKISATITAKYYFGAPVAQAKVKYKVLRTDHTASFYPVGNWDWFYEPGYWWFAYDYPWYPGWQEWGHRRPIAAWWGRSPAQPEVITENEVPLNADGTFKIEMDTAMAKAAHGNTDHQYEITAEVTDNSRRTIVGTGTVIVARKPFQVYGWVDRGHYRTGDAINADFSAQTLAHKPVQGKGTLKLLQVSYDKDGKPVEKSVQDWALDTDAEGKARMQMKAAAPGQYRLSFTVTDDKKHTIEGGYLFTVTGEGFNGTAFRFNDIEIIPEKREYAPGEKVKLLINANRENSTVLFFPRATNGICAKPKIIHLNGKSAVEELDIAVRDMPNIFIEAVVVSNGKVFAETKEIVVPPESRVSKVEVLPNEKEYKPGQKAKVRIKVTDNTGEPISGTTAVTVYDKSVEYISGGSNVAEIRSFFWKWRRQNYPQNESSLNKSSTNVLKNGEPGMAYLGVFGALSAESEQAGTIGSDKPGFGGGSGGHNGMRGERAKGMIADRDAAPMALAAAPASPAAEGQADGRRALRKSAGTEKQAGEQDESPSEPMLEPGVRKNFADTAFWMATLNTNKEGIAEFEFDMPESLTTWKMKVWSMSNGARVGQGDVEVLTKKNVIIRLQSPRFFTQKDEVVLSANVHNFLKEKKKVDVSLELDGGCIEPLDALKRSVEIEAGAELRVDWRVRVTSAGEATIRAKALTNEESDAMQLKFPAYIHGLLKTESFSGNIRPDKDTASIAFSVPAERRVADSRLEVRYSPTLAGAMVDALPYLVDYPYGCTEQTLSRFLPTAITQKVLLRMNINLKDVKDKITNLNAQEVGNDIERAKNWKRYDVNPVFDDAEVKRMVKAGIDRLAAMQCGDGGWGWFSGNGEYSSPHTTAYVVHGLQIAKNNGAMLPNGMLERGVNWLQSHQTQELQSIKNAPTKTQPYKDSADNLDAFIYMVMVDGGSDNAEMRDFLYRDRNNLAVYSKAMFGLALNKQKQAEKLAMIMQNIDQYLVQDNENQTAYLKLPESNYWWNWYGSEYEAQAYYLKLLAAVDPKSEKASRLVKYLLNNRRHATYWNSTRDTALCVEAMAEYLTASGEDAPDMSLDIVLDGKVAKTVAINASNLFSFDNKVVLTGENVSSGPHKLEFRKKGTGPVYFNAYSTNFTLEDDIKKAGLEIKVDRKYYKLKRVDKSIKVEGAHGQSVGQKVEKFEREPLANLDQLKSGDLVEVELEIDSKNDYEYVLFEDAKAAGFEPVEVRSGYNGNDMNAYVEFRDERVCLFTRQLARGRHSVAYRLRAEIPGTFSALPTKASAMYAPELKANSDEIKLKIAD